MYQFSGKLKTFSIVLILLGALGIAYSFYTAPSTVEEAKEIIAHQAAHDSHSESHGDVKAEEHAHNSEGNHVSEEAHGEHHNAKHDEHVLHQLQNKPWSAFYVALFFFLGITLLVLAFYASQRVAQSGWSIVLFRVMEAITANLVPTSIIMLLIIGLTVGHYNHLFPWMAEGIFDPTSPNYDPIVDGKSWWMNVPGWTIRGIFYLLVW
ncbi:MAG: quinol:cytochrome C oxidoreductase, partial [Flavobacteriaceae bacterium]